MQTPTWMTHLELDWECRAWRPWLDELTARHTVVRYDLRGCGLSDRGVEAQSLDSWVADLEAVVDAAGLERFPVFGLCQGAAIAAAYAARHPERVSRMVLYGSYAQGGLARRSAAAADEVLALGTLIQTGWGRPVRAFREMFASLLMPDAPPETVRSLAEMERHSAAPAMARRLWLAFHAVDITGPAAEILAPTLVAHCRNDAMVPFDEGRRVAMLVPGARFVALEGCNHILQPEEPCWGRLWDEVHEFLAEDVPAAAPGPPVFAGLTRREREVLGLVARARSNGEIAEALAISPKTVRNHITRIFGKLGVSRRAEAIVMARDAGLR